MVSQLPILFSDSRGQLAGQSSLLHPLQQTIAAGEARGLMYKVLIVDENAAIRRTLCALFDRAGGFKACAEAGNGAEGIAKTMKLSPNLVILDFSMPGMNGLELAQKLKAITPQLPIFMLTADYTVRLEKEALLSGITAVFSKLDDLASVVANARAVCGLE
jgi:two-component system, NarL family, response regulator EvgA